MFSFSFQKHLLFRPSMGADDADGADGRGRLLGGGEAALRGRRLLGAVQL